MTITCELRQQAAKAARGSPELERSPLDSYLIEREGGKWQAESRGLIVGSGLTLERAELLVAEHGAGRALWLVPIGGKTELLDGEL